jgi:hypothetical protein
MDTDPNCAVAHGDAIAHGYEAAPAGTRTLVAVFASPVADYLIRYGRDLGYRTTLVEPERGRVSNDEDAETTVLAQLPADLDGDTDVIVTDHHRPERPGERHRPRPPPDRPEHRLPHPRGDRDRHAGGPDRGPQRQTRWLRLLTPVSGL